MSDDSWYTFQAITDKYGVVPQNVEKFSYPMGDTTVRIEPGEEIVKGAQLLWIDAPAPDWTVIYAWAELMKDQSHRILVMPYLPSARGDKDLPGPARINAIMAANSGITDIITLDPHSRVWLNTLAELDTTIRRWNIPLAELVETATKADDRVYSGVIAPDGGAKDRAREVADKLGLPVYTATKKRDPATGWITSYEAPEGLSQDEHYLVVDDICDGGGTFNLLAEALKNIELDLWVSHGGFTKGLDELLKRYENIFTTDSLRSAVDLWGSDNIIKGYHIASLTKPVNKIATYISQNF